MDSKLATYQDQQDSDYRTYLNGEYTPSLNDDRIYLMREIACIEKHLANNESDEYVRPDEWNDRLAECRTRLHRLELERLKEESHTIHKTIMLHFDGINALEMRQNQIEAELARMEVAS